MALYLNFQAVYASPSRQTDADGGGSTEAGPISPDLLLMGIMASDVRMALRGFRDWCDALGLEYVLPENRVRDNWVENKVAMAGQTKSHGHKSL